MQAQWLCKPNQATDGPEGPAARTAYQGWAVQYSGVILHSQVKWCSLERAQESGSLGAPLYFVYFCNTPVSTSHQESPPTHRYHYRVRTSHHLKQQLHSHQQHKAMGLFTTSVAVKQLAEQNSEQRIRLTYRRSIRVDDGPSCSTLHQSLCCPTNCQLPSDAARRKYNCCFK